MTRQTFSDHVLRDYHRSHLSQTAEEIAEALQIPLHTLLERARRAGIVLSRDPTPLQEAAQRHAQWVYDLAIQPGQGTYTKVAQYVRLATSDDFYEVKKPRCPPYDCLCRQCRTRRGDYEVREDLPGQYFSQRRL